MTSDLLILLGDIPTSRPTKIDLSNVLGQMWIARLIGEIGKAQRAHSRLSSAPLVLSQRHADAILREAGYDPAKTDMRDAWFCGHPIEIGP